MNLLHFDTLLPKNGTILGVNEFFADKSYGLLWQKGQIRGFVDGLDSIVQAIYKILGTEKGAFLIYSDDYGLGVDDLVGLNHAIVQSELKRRIREALTKDKRIFEVNDFCFQSEKDRLYVKFTVETKEKVLDIDWRFEGL